MNKVEYAIVNYLDNDDIPKSDKFKDLIKSLNVWNEVTDKTKYSFIKLCTTKDIPLDERWGLYIAFSKLLLPIEQYDQSSKKILGVNVHWYKDHDVERHETVLYGDYIQDWIEGSDSKVAQQILANLDQVKENILNSGIAGFINYW